MSDKITFSNPRTRAQFNDWPIGGSDRGMCVFDIETKKGKQRAVRRTTNKNGVWCKPKQTSYYERVLIVDGSDGRTYILGLTAYGHIMVEQSDMKHSTGLHPEEGERFEQARALFDAAA